MVAPNLSLNVNKSKGKRELITRRLTAQYSTSRAFSSVKGIREFIHLKSPLKGANVVKAKFNYPNWPWDRQEEDSRYLLPGRHRRLAKVAAPRRLADPRLGCRC
jgi:hypothetical protein